MDGNLFEFASITQPTVQQLRLKIQRTVRGVQIFRDQVST